VTAPVLVPGDSALADLRLLLRGVHLPLDVLGGRVSPGAPVPLPKHTPPDAGGARVLVPMTLDVARVRVPVDMSEQVASGGRLVLADEESKPVATLTHATVLTEDDAGAVLEGALRPSEPDAWPSLSAASPGPASVVVVDRPMLHRDLDELTGLAGRGPVVAAVPVAGPTTHGVPADLLHHLATATTADVHGSVTVVPVDLYLRDPETDALLSRAVARALGADEPTHLSTGDDDWVRLLAALDEDAPLPALADDEVLTALRQWRPPLRRRGLVVFLTGLSGAGKSTLANALAAHVRTTSGRTVTLLDGDRVRRLLSAGLGFDRTSRDLNVRRIGYVAAEVARHGGIAICAPIAPYAESRAAVRAMAQEVGDFVLVHVHAPLAEVERRDVKGLYARARAGLVPGFTGVSDPYEEPIDADLVVDTSVLSADEALARLVDLLETGGWLRRTTGEER
jgi:sulfate adenylyltransferase